MKQCMLVVVAALGMAAHADEFTYTGQPRMDRPVQAWLDESALAAVPDRVRVASYNIEHFTDGIGDEPERTQEVVQHQARMAAGLLDEIDADVVVLMEIENAASLSELNRALKRPFPAGYITSFGEPNSNEKLNLGLLSRFPVKEIQEADFGPLTGPGRPARGYLRATIDLGDEHRLVIYTVHLKSNFGHRPRNIAQRQHALSLIASDARTLTAMEPTLTWEMLVAGDTNVDPELPEFAGDPSLRPLKDWKDLWRGRPLDERTTVPTRYGDPALEFPPACFDRLFASSALAQKPWLVGSPSALASGVDTRRVDSKPGSGTHISDHYPVYVDLTR